MTDFEKFKVGDKVLVHTWSGSFRVTHTYIPRNVVRVTKTTIVLDSGDIFNHNGSVRGGGTFGRKNLMEYNEEFYQKHLKEVADVKKKEECLKLINATNFNTLSMEKLEIIYNTLLT